MMMEKTVLVVDDIAANRNLLGETLEPKGYEVLLASNGAMALKVAAKAKPSVILMDVNMPDMDGYEACRQLKTNPGLAEIPVIFITANDDPDSLVKGFEAGGVDYVTKPFKAQEVLMRLKTHMRLNHLTQTLLAKNQELEAEIDRRRQAEQSLSLIEKKQAERFHTSGTLRHDAASYVEHQADWDLVNGLASGEFCYVLTSRQMGKSSLMVRSAWQLRNQGARVVTLDLTALGYNLTVDQWYEGLLLRLGWQTQLEEELEAFWTENGKLSPMQRFFAAIRRVVLEQFPEPLVVFIDELDMLRSLPFRTDEFLAAIREGYNQRSVDGVFNRLTFCLLGVATPSELIKDSRMTPFNIGQRIELEDFSVAESGRLAKGLGRSPEGAADLMERIFHWTNGHPYLTQKFCKHVASEEKIQTQSEIDDACSHLFLSLKAREQDDNLHFVREQILRSRMDRSQLLCVYATIRSGQCVEANDSDPILNALRISGIVRSEDGVLKVRNRIYEHVFDMDWVQRLALVGSPAGADAGGMSK